ncbi:zinc finger CCCH domain-containing protein 41-like [Dorcoceras hygrometricum]|uniref:Zinc finger CCCH domain-containing protein 41-like n=1 Tax=Dorcoceras hygrometricum TaxID=472368 RepID=A0A2Z7CZI3_9LAMI|nr:zinc finger CCCH domain-containing protein 41-like [Dorcoceras hygrometricum]
MQHKVYNGCSAFIEESSKSKKPANALNDKGHKVQHRHNFLEAFLTAINLCPTVIICTEAIYQKIINSTVYCTRDAQEKKQNGHMSKTGHKCREAQNRKPNAVHNREFAHSGGSWCASRSHAQEGSTRRFDGYRPSANTQSPSLAPDSAFVTDSTKDITMKYNDFSRGNQHFTVGGGRLRLIRSTTESKVPSSTCTRRPDEISTDGNSSKSWPEQIPARGGGGGGSGRRRRLWERRGGRELYFGG